MSLIEKSRVGIKMTGIYCIQCRALTDNTLQRQGIRNTANSWMMSSAAQGVETEESIVIFEQAHDVKVA